MPLRGGFSKTGIGASIVPAGNRTNATVTGEYVDLQGYEEVDVVITTGTITDGTHTFSLTECDTSGGSYTAVAAADIIVNASFGGTAANGAVLDTTATHDNACITFGYIGTKRYIRVVCVTAGSTTGGIFSAGVIGMRKRHST